MDNRRFISYEKLFVKLLHDNIKQKDLQKEANISSSTMNKLKKNKNINTDVLVKICDALDCELYEIAEISKGENND